MARTVIGPRARLRLIMPFGASSREKSTPQADLAVLVTIEYKLTAFLFVRSTDARSAKEVLWRADRRIGP